MFVTYHVHTQEATEARTTLDGFEMGEDSWGASDCWDGCGCGERNDQTPTTHEAAPRNMAILTVDLADARTNKLVWRAQAAIDSVSPTQKGDEKQVEHAVERMFKKYPPKWATEREGERLCSRLSVTTTGASFVHSRVARGTR